MVENLKATDLILDSALSFQLSTAYSSPHWGYGHFWWACVSHFFFKKDLFVLLCICVFVPAWFYVHHGNLFASCVCGCPLKPEGIALPELELQGLVNHLMWVLGIKPRVSVRAMHTLKCWAICPASLVKFLMNRWRALSVELVRRRSFFAGRITLPPKCRWLWKQWVMWSTAVRYGGQLVFRHSFKNKLCSWKVCRTCFCEE